MLPKTPSSLYIDFSMMLYILFVKFVKFVVRFLVMSQRLYNSEPPGSHFKQTYFNL